MREHVFKKATEVRPFLFPLALIALILIPVFSIFYLKSESVSPADACSVKCAASGKTGSLVYQHRPEVTAGMRSPGPMRCECY